MLCARPLRPGPVTPLPGTWSALGSRSVSVQDQGRGAPAGTAQLLGSPNWPQGTRREAARLIPGAHVQGRVGLASRRSLAQNCPSFQKQKEKSLSLTEGKCCCWLDRCDSAVGLKMRSQEGGRGSRVIPTKVYAGQLVLITHFKKAASQPYLTSLVYQPTRYPSLGHGVWVSQLSFPC